jgi:3-oxoadipate enol-lactonase
LESKGHWVFLHGTPLTPEVWTSIAHAVSSAVTSISRPSLNSRGDAAAHAARIADQLPKHDMITVVGHSFGGQVAIDLALVLAREKRLGGLALLCTRATPFPPFREAAEVIRSAHASDPEAAIDRWFTPEERRYGAPVIEYAKERLRDADPEVWADALESISRYDRESDLATISAPSMVIAAEYDIVSPPGVMEAMAARLPGSRFHVLRDTSHMGPFLRPDVISDLLRQGLGREARTVGDRGSTHV